MNNSKAHKSDVSFGRGIFTLINEEASNFVHGLMNSGRKKDFDTQNKDMNSRSLSDEEALEIANNLTPESQRRAYEQQPFSYQKPINTKSTHAKRQTVAPQYVKPMIVQHKSPTPVSNTEIAEIAETTVEHENKPHQEQVTRRRGQGLYGMHVRRNR